MKAQLYFHLIVKFIVTGLQILAASKSYIKKHHFNLDVKY